MFSRAQTILGAFDRQPEKNDNEIPQEVEEQEDVVFHTLGNLHQYKGLLSEDTEGDEKQKDVMFHTLGILEQYQDILLGDGKE